MDFLQTGLANLIEPGFNALIFSLFGMGLVFSGLVVIGLYIIFLPKLLNLFQKRSRKKTEPATPATPDTKHEILLAIATALHLQSNFPDENERLTWKSHGDLESPWLVSKRMHALAQRKSQSSPWRQG
ncbi:MAG: OadG family protein [Desulfobulbaceae bacterium]|uniref:OadG family protein n=1 Tax=Candidatus Desulfatifera sulfidica TaxID=2841691 RepID=A0A8J6TCV3_9BACT|nr:OadG family protein [Candidatus Desulfatifera sulfidica]